VRRFSSKVFIEDASTAAFYSKDTVNICSLLNHFEMKLILLKKDSWGKPLK
jgi:hypothetical protein